MKTMGVFAISQEKKPKYKAAGLVYMKGPNPTEGSICSKRKRVLTLSDPYCKNWQ